MKPLGWLAVAVTLFGCATPPQPEFSVDTGTTTAAEGGDARHRARIHTELAALYFSRRNMAVALEELRIAQEADPKYAPAYSVLGLVYMELRENRLAEQTFQDGLRIAPQDSDLHHNYGWFLCQTGRERDAIKHFTTAVRNPLYAQPWRSNSAAGACLMRVNDMQGAEVFFERALADEPNEIGALLQLGQIRHRQERLDDARRLVARFNTLVEPTAESLWLALRIERKLGNRGAEQSFATQLRKNHATSREFQMLQRGEYE